MVLLMMPGLGEGRMVAAQSPQDEVGLTSRTRHGILSTISLSVHGDGATEPDDPLWAQTVGMTGAHRNLCQLGDDEAQYAAAVCPKLSGRDAFRQNLSRPDKLLLASCTALLKVFTRKPETGKLPDTRKSISYRMNEGNLGIPEGRNRRGETKGDINEICSL